MALRYNYVNPKELNPFQLIEPGEGKFRVLKVEERTSQNGNEMMVIGLRLTDRTGATTLCNEYLVSSDNADYNKKTATKVYNLLNAINKPELYGKPLYDRDIIGCEGRCIIKTEKSNNPDYSDRSVIAKYISVVNPEHYEERPEIDDDIPF